MEQDVRVSVVGSILDTPHRELDALLPLHVNAAQRDPLFYVKFALWYLDNGSVRDHNKLFASRIVTSDYVEFRSIGQQLLRRMGIRDFVTTKDFAVKHFNAKSSGRFRRIRKAAESYIRDLEKSASADGGLRLLRNYKAIRNIYVGMQIAPGSPDVAKSFRFKSDGKLLPVFAALKSLKTMTEAEVCETITLWKLPPVQVSSIVKSVTPAVAAAMLVGMSPAETVNFMKVFEKKGLLDHPGFKKKVQEKAARVTKSSSLRSTKAAKSLERHSDLATETTEAFIRSLPPIKKRILLAIDKSFSMQAAINLGKEVATILAAKVANPYENLQVCVFDSTVKKIELPENISHAGFEAKFRYIQANGTTALGAVINYAEKFTPDTILFITDAEETTVPFLNSALKKIKKDSWVQGLKLVNCKIGSKTFDLKVDTDVISGASLAIDNFDYKGDFYSLPNLVKLVSAGGIRDLIEMIDEIDPFTYFEKRRK